MTNLFINRKFPMMSNTSVFDEIMEEFFKSPTSIIGKEKSSYPMNITKKVKDGEVISYQLTYALAGFAKEDIKITIKDDVLKIEAKHDSKTTDETENDDEPIVETVYHGISYKNMSMSFKLMNNVDKENITSKYENGLLEIIVPAKKEEDGCINVDIL